MQASRSRSSEVLPDPWNPRSATGMALALLEGLLALRHDSVNDGRPFERGEDI